ncbi:tripartite tricarboxylate transporter substrate-binding protein [Pollutimonas bauzanensis]|uniref:tripartite tricarboxylate transporter substrate-binding protein n=1 Tax=Pollutimonas bauzanensis TaxID=658167 RepID=UPI00333E40FD
MRPRNWVMSKPTIYCLTIMHFGCIAAMKSATCLSIASHSHIIRTQETIAALTPDRFSALTDVPALAEVGLNDHKAEIWLGLLAPAKPPPPYRETAANRDRAYREDGKCEENAGGTCR